MSIFAFVSYGQEVRTGVSVVESKVKTQSITYYPQVSSPDSYTIVKNTNNVALTEEQLKEMNKHRDFEKAVEWEINSDLIILLKPFEN